MTAHLPTPTTGPVRGPTGWTAATVLVAGLLSALSIALDAFHLLTPYGAHLTGIVVGALLGLNGANVLQRRHYTEALRVAENWARIDTGDAPRLRARLEEDMREAFAIRESTRVQQLSAGEGDDDR